MATEKNEEIAMLSAAQIMLDVKWKAWKAADEAVTKARGEWAKAWDAATKARAEWAVAKEAADEAWAAAEKADAKKT